jgi:hypothetical protein
LLAKLIKDSIKKGEPIEKLTRYSAPKVKAVKDEKQEQARFRRKKIDAQKSLQRRKKEVREQRSQSRAGNRIQ